ncbi:zinc finger protein DZIP1L isoform X2 [Numida meleagris]|uniref:zinc finger protein DZIP1L isoform X2 n=1 Tax=Numida meleagris TaxID=8996 RepID=UPI000B3D9978|nr:zinc finger protein DZIP1L isoform X2 [Numida meleagris]
MAMLAALPALTIPPDTFRFQPRHVSVDWHRLGAVDVEQVAQEGDVAALQEHITDITFCNLAGEKCPHCRQPADPMLLKVLRLAQLSIEYLLHCQQRLADSLTVHAQQLQDAHAQLARAQGLASEQTVRLRGEKEESRRWKKLVATQLLLQASPSDYCKVCGGRVERAGLGDPRDSCVLRDACARATWDILWPSDRLLVAIGFGAHLGFYPPTEVFTPFQQKPAGRASLSTSSPLPNEPAHLLPESKSHPNLVAQVHTTCKNLRLEQSLLQCHLCDKAFMSNALLQAHMQRWHPEEGEHWRGSQQLSISKWMLGAFQGAAGAGRSHPRSRCLCSPSFAETKKVEQMEEEVEELKAKLRKMQQQLSAGREAEKLHREQEEERALQREVEGRRDFERWKEEERMKLHVEMDGLKQRFLTELQDAARRSSAMEGTKLLSANKPEVTQHVTKVVVSEESSEGDTMDDAQGGKRQLLEALWRKPNLLKKFRRILEEAMEEKLESMGVSRVAKGISNQTYQHLWAVLRLQQHQKAKNTPGLFHIRDELIQVMMRRVRQCKKPSIPLPRQISIIPGTAVSMKGKPLERHLDVTTRRPAGGMKSQP